ncbi:phosphodiesterase [compost metagenome]
MKIAFISDIHGNSVALEAVIADIRSKSMDQIYVLGDLCYRGPDPKGSLERIRSLQTLVIKGNADEWVVRGVRAGEVPEQVLDMMNREREWTVGRLEQTDIEYLQSLPTELELTIEDVKIHAFHATPDSLFEIVLPHTDDDLLVTKLMSGKEADVYLYAHIHKPYIRYLNGKVIMNIGSVGLPFDGLAQASYGIVEVEQGNLRTSIVRVQYPIEKVIQQYEAVHYPNAEMMTRIVRNARVK